MRRERGVAGTNYRGPQVRIGARVPTLLPVFLSFSIVSLFAFFAQVNPFIPTPSLSATDSRGAGHLFLSQYKSRIKIFSRSARTGRPEFFFHRDPNPFCAELILIDVYLFPIRDKKKLPLL